MVLFKLVALSKLSLCTAEWEGGKLKLISRFSPSSFLPPNFIPNLLHLQTQISCPEEKNSQKPNEGKRETRVKQRTKQWWWERKRGECYHFHTEWLLWLWMGVGGLFGCKSLCWKGFPKEGGWLHGWMCNRRSWGWDNNDDNNTPNFGPLRNRGKGSMRREFSLSQDTIYSTVLVLPYSKKGKRIYSAWMRGKYSYEYMGTTVVCCTRVLIHKTALYPSKKAFFCCYIAYWLRTYESLCIYYPVSSHSLSVSTKRSL